MRKLNYTRCYILVFFERWQIAQQNNSQMLKFSVFHRINIINIKFFLSEPLFDCIFTSVITTKTNIMNTIIEITYKNYTENVIVNKDNENEIIEILMNDIDVVDFETVVEGDFDFEGWLSEPLSYYDTPAIVLRIDAKMEALEIAESAYYITNTEKKRNEAKRDTINKMINNLTNIERAFASY